MSDIQARVAHGGRSPGMLLHLVDTENPSENSDGNFMTSLNCKVEDEDIVQHSSGDVITIIVHPKLESPDPSYDPPNHEEPSPDQSPSFITENRSENSEGSFMPSLTYKVEDDEDSIQHSSGENYTICHVDPKLESPDLSYDPPNHEEPSPDQSQNFTPSTENPSENSDGNFMSSINCKVEDDEDIMQHSSGENLIIHNVHPKLESPDRSYDPPNHEEPSPDQSHSFITSTGQNIFIYRIIHTGEEPHSSSECGKGFAEKSNLVTREKRHKRVKPHSCLACDKCYSYKSDLVTHERIHKREKSHSCLECGKCYSYKSDLVRHERIHTEEKLFSCSECGKCFTFGSSLVRHMRIHTGEKPYSCSQCGKGFIEKSRLVLHERLHTGEKPFSCSECEECFISYVKLRDHQRIHTGEKPFLCTECGECFTTNIKRRNHQKHHQGENTF